MRKKLTGKKRSKETIEKLKDRKGPKNPMYGKKPWNKGLKFFRLQSTEERKNRRIKHIARIKENYGNAFPNYNKKACEWFKEFDVYNNTKGQYALYGGGEYLIEELGYWTDYINRELKIIIEWDEKRHYKNGVLQDKDVMRQNEIQSVFKNYSFFRIKE